MEYLIKILQPHLNYYSGIFVLLWSAMLASYIILCALESKKHKYGTTKLQSWLYIIFSFVLIAFAALRPVGISRDDLTYVDIYNKLVLSNSIFDQLVHTKRDWGWYSLVSIFNLFWQNPRVIFLISALALSAKLWVVYKLTCRPLLALLFFTGVFYQVQDLTVFRVSLALTFFMVAIYLLVKRNFLIGTIGTFITFLFHKQALLTPLILISWILRRQYLLFVMLTLFPIILLFVGFSFEGYKAITPYLSLPWIQLLVSHGLDGYIAAGQSGAYNYVRIMPYSYFPLIILMVFLARDVFSDNNYLYRYCGMSFIIACWLIWFFAGWQEPQARFFEYFALPTVLLVGNFRNSLTANLGVFLVAGIFVVRYNVLHPLLG